MAEGATLSRKMGPLPVWAWGIIGGIAVYFLYTRYKAGQTSTSTATGPTASVLDPNAVDPATGMTYGQELAGSFPVSSPGTGGTGTTTSDTGLASGADFVSGFDSGQAAFMSALDSWQQLASQVGQTPANPSVTTMTAASSAPLQNTNPPKAANAHARGPISTAAAKAAAPFAGNPTRYNQAFNQAFNEAAGHTTPHQIAAAAAAPYAHNTAQYNRVYNQTFNKAFTEKKKKK